MDIHHGEEHFHSAWTLRPEHVCLILHHAVLRAHLICRLCLIWVCPVVVDAKLGAQKVAPHFAEEACGVLGDLLLVHTDHVVRGGVTRALFACEQELVGRREGEGVLGPEAVHAVLVSHDCALHLANPGREWSHVHLSQLLDWRERVQQLRDERIVVSFILLVERGLWDDRWLVVGRRIIELFVLGWLGHGDARV